MQPPPAIIKFPRTPHIEGSRLQPGDEDISQIPFSFIANKVVTVTEKLDGANSAISFDAGGHMLLQSRGHYLTGGYREKHYQLMKTWAQVHRRGLYDALGSRYILYGEWLYAKHTIYYDALPHYFMAFDVFDREQARFADTDTWRAQLCGLPICAAPVLARRAFASLPELTALLGKSRFITDNHIARLTAYCDKNGENTALRLAETDRTPIMEGLYIKLEGDGMVGHRMKFVRATFTQNVAASDTHWLSRPIIPNGLDKPVEALYAACLPGAGDEP